VHLRRVRSCRKTALTLPSPASGRGEKPRQNFMTHDVGMRRT
jgi:hypothetical protein